MLRQNFYKLNTWQCPGDDCKSFCCVTWPSSWPRPSFPFPFALNHLCHALHLLQYPRLSPDLHHWLGCSKSLILSFFINSVKIQIAASLFLFCSLFSAVNSEFGWLVTLSSALAVGPIRSADGMAAMLHCCPWGCVWLWIAWTQVSDWLTQRLLAPLPVPVSWVR